MNLLPPFKISAPENNQFIYIAFIHTKTHRFLVLTICISYSIWNIKKVILNHCVPYMAMLIFCIYIYMYRNRLLHIINLHDTSCQNKCKYKEYQSISIWFKQKNKCMKCLASSSRDFLFAFTPSVPAPRK